MTPELENYSKLELYDFLIESLSAPAFLSSVHNSSNLDQMANTGITVSMV